MSTLLCIHGWPMASATFSSLADALPHFNVISPNLPGFGGTSDQDFDHSLDTYADFICEIAGALSGPIHLLGLSMGGKIAMHIAARRPAWLRSLILLAPSYPDATIVSPEALASQLAAFADIDALVVLMSGWANDVEPLVTWAQLASRDAYTWWLTDGRPADIAGHVREITVPTLVLHGELDPLRTVAQLQTTIVDRLPNALMQVVDGASHCIHMDEPDKVAAMIDEWLTRHNG